MAAKGTIVAGFRFRVAKQLGMSMRSPLKSARRAASSAGILMYGSLAEGWRSCWCTRADLTGGARTTARRPFRKAKWTPTRTRRSRLPGVRGGDGRGSRRGAARTTRQIRQRAGKRVIAFAVEADINVGSIRSNTFEIEWPPRNEKMQSFPEINRAEWFELAVAHSKIIKAKGPCSTGSLSMSVSGRKLAP